MDLVQQFHTLSRQFNKLFGKTQTFTPDSTQKMENMVQQINNLAQQIVKLSQELKI
jgi:flagellar hook-associated protein FlgK